jgi:hypothetical protein
MVEEIGLLNCSNLFALRDVNLANLLALTIKNIPSFKTFCFSLLLHRFFDLLWWFYLKDFDAEAGKTPTFCGLIQIIVKRDIQLFPFLEELIEFHLTNF